MQRVVRIQKARPVFGLSLEASVKAKYVSRRAPSTHETSFSFSSPFSAPPRPAPPGASKIGVSVRPFLIAVSLPYVLSLRVVRCDNVALV